MFSDESGVSVMEKSKGTEKLKKIPKEPAEVGDLLSEESSRLDGGILPCTCDRVQDVHGP